MGLSKTMLSSVHELMLIWDQRTKAPFIHVQYNACPTLAALVRKTVPFSSQIAAYGCFVAALSVLPGW